MRFVVAAILGALLVSPAQAQYYYPAPVYGYREAAPDAWSAARQEWHRARRAEEIARWRAANGDYDGANRAAFWAQRHREMAHRDAYVARGGW